MRLKRIMYRMVGQSTQSVNLVISLWRRYSWLNAWVPLLWDHFEEGV